MNHRILIVGGVGHVTGLIEAIRPLHHVAEVIVVDDEQELRSDDFDAKCFGEPLPIIRLAFKESFKDYDFYRERNYPTLREGIRRKSIKNLGKRR